MIKIYIEFILNCIKNNKKDDFPLLLNKAIKVLNTINKTKKNTKIEKVRNNLHIDKQVINIVDLGAGSKFNRADRRKISYIAKSSLTKEKYCIFLQKLIEESNSSRILELGTSFGITTMYMKLAKNNPQIITIEGDSKIAEIAENNFNSQNLNIKLINLNFDDYFNQETYKNNIFDFVFIDGNHKKDSTLRYFNLLKNNISEKGIIVFDDIRWSKGMNEAWSEIIANSEAGYFLDLFKMGIYFMDKSVKKQYYCKLF